MRPEDVDTNTTASQTRGPASRLQPGLDLRLLDEDESKPSAPNLNSLLRRLVLKRCPLAPCFQFVFSVDEATWRTERTCSFVFTDSSNKSLIGSWERGRVVLIVSVAMQLVLYTS
ncbi:unnamed protein product [Pleuronectes platessa]|uniref:Uncharacterized protein n=1 Tax=Pleuronectes platessa TaxID=8262 RepID=A0A9N7VWL8_PLEPL|nr:unnamed protein product [Pleuronectes platessa]